MREIKFRAWVVNSAVKEMIYPENTDINSPIAKAIQYQIGYNDAYPEKNNIEDWQKNILFMQFTGLKDKNGKEIYEGDLLRYRNPEIGYQTHTGDNIPNGSYTEPTGAIVLEKEYEVIFHCGCFQLLDTNTRGCIPIQYLFNEQTEELLELDHDAILKQIDLKRNRDVFDDDYSESQEELEFLLEDLEMTLSTLIDHCKLEIIGNIYEI